MCHWDIKPENIMFSDNFEVQLVDFGLSKIIEEEQNVMTYDGEQELIKGTSTGMTGTLLYMSPEIVKKWTRKEKFFYDPFKSDMWSLGITLYWLVTNKLPFTGDWKNVLKILQDPNFEVKIDDNLDPWWKEIL